MAPSPPNPGRPRLGTVLSRKNWEDRRSNSTTSSVTSHGSVAESTHASFDPENEALVSTQPLDLPPPIKNSQKGREDGEYHIDMKAAKAAFSEGSESGSDADDISIEVGRGGRRGRKILEDSRNDESIHSSDAMIGDYKVMYTPPLSTYRHSSKINNNDHARNLRQDAQIRLASMVSQKENRDPAPQPFKSFKSLDVSNKVKRKTLGELSVRASEIYDGPPLDDDRPTQVAPATKTTRFSRSKASASGQTLVNGTNTASDMADFNQSYILPDLPNISQLMTGTNQDRTPGRIRLTAHPALSHTPRGQAHKPIDAVPIPDDEKAIFVSLNLLQGKVNQLEAATAEFQKTIEELKTKNLVLKAEKKDLKAENERLRQENQKLRSGHASTHERHHSNHQPQNQVSPQRRMQANASAQVTSEVLRILRERQEKDLFSLTPTETVNMRPMSAPPQRSNTSDQKISTALASGPQQKAAPWSLRHGKKVVIEECVPKTDQTEVRDRAREQPPTEDITYLSTQPASQDLLDLRNMLEVERIDKKKRRSGKEGNKAISTATHGQADATAFGHPAQPTVPRKPSMKDTNQRTLSSETAAGTFSKLRAEKENTSHSAYDQDVYDDTIDQISRPISHTARRNSDPTATAASNTSRRRRRTTDLDDENMTSAFIIPDITIAQPTAAPVAPAAAATSTIPPATTLPEPHLTHAAQHVIHSINPHDASNCIICSRLTSSSSTNPTGAEKKKTITIPRPIPVSATPVPATPDNPDPTLRPAQPPGVALAIVLKELNDQHEHVKARLAKAQARYQQTDPRLSRAKRARLSREIEALQRQCEGVADMIYRLYDVLEGQKLEGVEMGSEELEVTVQGLREVLGRMGGRSGSREDGESEDGSE